MPGVLRTEPARRPQLVSHTVVTANANRPTLPLERDEGWQPGKTFKKGGEYDQLEVKQNEKGEENHSFFWSLLMISPSFAIKILYQ